MTKKELFKAAHRLNRSLRQVHIHGGSPLVKNGLYPSFLPKLLYKEFLAMMVMADVANAPLSHNNLLRRYKHAERVNQAVARLDWCEHTDWADVQRVVRNLLRDLYCL